MRIARIWDQDLAINWFAEINLRNKLKWSTSVTWYVQLALSSLRRYFQPATTLPTASQTQLSPNVLQEVNQAVGALKPKENGASKRNYTISFTPEDRARIGKYASENVNAAAVKKFKATHEIGESTVRL